MAPNTASLNAEALALARAGRLQAARLSSNRAMDLALQEGQRETAASNRAANGVGSLLRKCHRRKKERHGSAKAFQGPGGPIPAGLALAFSGESSRSEALAGDLETRFPKMLLSNLPIRAVSDPESIGNRSVRILRYY